MNENKKIVMGLSIVLMLFILYNMIDAISDVYYQEYANDPAWVFTPLGIIYIISIMIIPAILGYFIGRYHVTV